MTLPAPFQSVFDQWRREGTRVLQADWTTNLHRHVGARIEYTGKPTYAKLAIAKKKDLDESDMLAGMRRELWWSQVIQRLRRENEAFPFTSPRVIATNVRPQPFDDDVAWVIMEYIDGKPIIDWESEQSDRQMSNTEDDRFNRVFDAVISSLLALEQVHPNTLARLDLPPLPSPSHGMRRWPKEGIARHGNSGAWQRRV